MNQPTEAVMDEKVSVSLRQTDDGKIICSRSWNEGKDYQNEEIVMDEKDLTPAIKAFFKKGKYKKTEAKEKTGFGFSG